MTFPAWQYRSAAPGISWPAIPGPEASALLALQHQLERTQWWAAGELVQRQLEQLELSIRHA